VATIAKYLIVLAISTVAVIVPFVVFGDTFDGWAVMQLEAQDREILLFLFGVSVLAVDGLLPIPSSIVAAILVGTVGPAWGALAIWVGSLLASVLGYAVGRLAGRLVVSRERETAHDLAKEVGIWAVLLTKAVPVLGEAVTLTAGALRLSFGLFTAVSALASLILAATYAGHCDARPGILGAGAHDVPRGPACADLRPFGVSLPRSPISEQQKQRGR